MVGRDSANPAQGELSLCTNSVKPLIDLYSILFRLPGLQASAARSDLVNLINRNRFPFLDKKVGC